MKDAGRGINIRQFTITVDRKSEKSIRYQSIKNEKHQWNPRNKQNGKKDRGNKNPEVRWRVHKIKAG